MLDNSLQKHIPDEGKLLWVLEEAGNISPALIARYADRSTVLSNRYDLHQHYQTLCRSVLSDFELAEDDFAAVIFYLSKERLISNYVIAACATWLNASGSLILAGRKNEGIKNYFAKLNAKTALKKDGDLYVGASFRPTNNPEAIASYQQIISLPVDEHLNMLSKPGVFSWKQTDQGSAFLIQTLQQNSVDFKSKNMLDLGCGNGYLAMWAAKHGAGEIVATDNNFTAVAICQKNFQQLGQPESTIDAIAVVDDCAKEIQEKFDFVLCNPPFHRGKQIDTELTQKFVTATRHLLNTNGEAWFVVNAFIPLETVAERNSLSTETIANNRQFKVLRLRHHT